MSNDIILEALSTDTIKATKEVSSLFTGVSAILSAVEIFNRMTGGTIHVY